MSLMATTTTTTSTRPFHLASQRYVLCLVSTQFHGSLGIGNLLFARNILKHKYTCDTRRPIDHNDDALKSFGNVPPNLCGKTFGEHLCDFI